MSTPKSTGTEIMRVSGMEDTTPITIKTSEQTIAMSVVDVLRWIAPGAPPEEAFKFLMICKASQANPILKEAHLVCMGGTWATIIDKSGWLKRAELDPRFDGHRAGIVIQEYDKGPPPKRGPATDVEGALLPPGHVVIGGWAEVYRKDRTRPVVQRVSITEYKKNSPTWDQIPCTMIRKVALVQALREAGFIPSGAYDTSEMPAMVSIAESEPSNPMPGAIDVEFSVVETPQLSPSLAARVHEAIQANNMSEAQIANMLARRGVDFIVELTDTQAIEILTKLNANFDQVNAGRIMLPDPADAQTENDDNGEMVVDSFVIANAS